MAVYDDTDGPRGKFWRIQDASNLPNLSGSGIQDETVIVGDMATVLGVPYKCTDATLAAAVWERVLGTGPTRVGVVDGVILATTGTDVAYATAGDEYVCELILRHDQTLTGAAILNGPLVGTDKIILILWDEDGTVVRTSALAGTTTAGADAWQQVAFTSTYAAPAGRYFVGVQANGTTDNMHCLAAGGLNSTQLNTTDQAAFGTVSALAVVPSTFTADVGPIMYVY